MKAKEQLETLQKSATVSVDEAPDKTEDGVDTKTGERVEAKIEHTFEPQIVYPCTLTALKTNATGENKTVKVLCGSLTLNLIKINSHLPVGGILPEAIKDLLWFIAENPEASIIQPSLIAWPFDSIGFWIARNKGLQLKLFENADFEALPTFDGVVGLESTAMLRVSDDFLFLDVKFQKQVEKMSVDIPHKLSSIVKTPFYCKVIVAQTEVFR